MTRRSLPAASLWILLQLICASLVWADSSGPNIAGSGNTVSSGSGSVAWSNPGNITANDGAAASVSIGFGGQSDNLQATNFNFAIPAGSTINGIQVDMSMSASISGSPEGLPQLLKGGTTCGPAKAQTSFPGGSLTLVTFGGSTDLWQCTLAASDVNASNFGVQYLVLAGSGSATVNVDFVQITVFYTPPAPAAPTNLQVTAAANGASNSLTWTNNATTQTSYQINKCSGASCSPTTYQTGLAASATSFTDSSGVTPGTTYGYQACAVNSGGTSCSTTTFVTEPTAPPPPTNLTVTAGSAGTSNILSWTNNATNQTSYQINKCTGASCSPTSYVTGLAANSTGFTDGAGVSPGNTYGYQACAVNAVGTACSTTTFVTEPTAPAAPTNLTVTAGGAGTSNTLSWTNNATNQTSYQINKCAGAACSPTTYVTGLAANTTNFVDSTGVAPGNTYGYQACAVNGVGTACSATTFVTEPVVVRMKKKTVWSWAGVQPDFRASQWSTARRSTPFQRGIL